MPIAGSTSPAWSNEDADDFWDDDLGALDDEEAFVAPTDNLGVENGSLTKNIDHLSKPHAPNGVKKVPVEETPVFSSTKVEKTVEKAKVSGSGINPQIPHKSTEISAENKPEIDDSEKNGESDISSVEEKAPIPVAVDLKPKELAENDQKVQALVGPETPKEPHSGPALKSAEDISGYIEDSSIPTTNISLEKSLQTSNSSKNHKPAVQTIEPKVNGTKIDQTIEKAEIPTTTGNSVPENVQKVVLTEQNNETPRETPEVLELTEQIKALKFELEQKDAKLLELEKADLDKGMENGPDENALTQKVHQLEETLQQTELERDRAQGQLEGFLSKISSMKTVFQNFKATQEELEEVKQELVEANEHREKAVEDAKVAHAKVSRFEETQKQFAAEYEKWESEHKKSLSVIENLKTEALDLNSECDRLSQLLGTLRREFQAKEETLQDEKYSLENEVGRLNKKLSEQKRANNELELAKEEAVMENKNLTLAAEDLKERLEDKDREFQKLQSSATGAQEVLEVKINELESVIQAKAKEIGIAQAKIEQLEQEILLSKEEAQRSNSEMETLRKETEKVKQLEEDVHSKQLIIGKLRHEAIILNEHLTKSISMLKQKLGDVDTTVDRELVSNLILNFLQIPRGDTKKFEALSLIGGLLDWDDQQKIQAGLMHSSKNDDTKPQRLAFISLWTDFLDKESSKK